MKQSKPILWKTDGKFVGYRLQEGHASEHEHGIHSLNRAFEIYNYKFNDEFVCVDDVQSSKPYENTAYIPILGIERNIPNNDSLSDIVKADTRTSGMYYIYGSTNNFGSSYEPKSMNNYIDFFNYKRYAEWSSAGFCILDDSYERLWEVKNAFDHNDGVVRYNVCIREGYANFELIIAIRSRITKNTIDCWYREDLYNYTAWNELFRTNLPKLIKNPLFVLFPVISNNTLIVYFDRKWYYVEQLEELLKEEGDKFG